MRVWNFIKLLKLCDKASHRYKDDRARVPVFQEFTNLVGEKNKNLRKKISTFLKRKSESERGDPTGWQGTDVQEDSMESGGVNSNSKCGWT